METYTYEQLKDMTVAQLREIAKDVQHDALEGYSTMHKDHLLPALCKALNIEHHHIAAGAEKARLKAILRKLKTRRSEATASKNAAQQATVRHQIHTIKHRLRRMADQSA